jgi:3-phenylpropionate/trans-cinnamate dioxygenase ferredoxin subunit
MALIKVGQTTEIPEGEARRFDVADTHVCVVNLGEAGFRAIGDLCTHAQAWLSDGDVDVEDETLECPLHGSTFDLNTGAVRALPATVGEPVYPVKIEGDDLLIEVTMQ